MTSATQDLKPVLFVLTSHSVKGETGESTGFYLGEVTHPLAVLDAAGIPVEFASIAGGEPPVDGLDLNDAVNARYWNSEGYRHAIRNTSRLSDVDPKDYSAIFFAGGHGAMWDFPTSPAVNSVARDIYEAGGVVAAVCHGPAALVNITLSSGAHLVAGKNVAALPTTRNGPSSWTRRFPSCLPARFPPAVHIIIRPPIGRPRLSSMEGWSPARTRSQQRASAKLYATC